LRTNAATGRSSAAAALAKALFSSGGKRTPTGPVFSSSKLTAISSEHQPYLLIDRHAAIFKNNTSDIRGLFDIRVILALPSSADTSRGSAVKRPAKTQRLIEFKWTKCVAGYELANGEKIIRAVGSRWEESDPLVRNDFYTVFARAQPTPQGMLEFSNRFGLLRALNENHAVPTGISMRTTAGIDDMLAEHRLLRTALRKYENGDPKHLVHSFNITRGWMRTFPTVLRRGDQLELIFIPPDLITGMWLQFAQHAAAGGTLLRCKRCSNIFVPQRSTGEYCGPACRQGAFKNRRRLSAAS
jgi:hypothetical protein